MNFKKIIIILIIIISAIILFDNILSKQEGKTNLPDEAYNYYIYMFPELKEAIREDKVKDINIVKKIEGTDISIYIDGIMYDIKNNKILLMYHIKNLKETDKVKYIKATIKDPKNNSWTRTVAMGKLTKLDEGIRLNDEFYGILAFETLKDTNGTKYQPEKCNLELNIGVNTNRYQLYNIFLELL